MLENKFAEKKTEFENKQFGDMIVFPVQHRFA